MGPEAGVKLLRPLVARQEQVITQTIALPQTTFTTHVTLGGSQPTAANTANSNANNGSPPPATSNHQGNAGLSEAAVGAIAGSVAGVFLLVIVLACCCRWPRRASAYNRQRGSSDYGGPVGPGGGMYQDRWPPAPRSPPRGRTPRPMSQPFMMPPPFLRPQRSPRSARATPRPPPAAFFPPPEPERIPGGPKWPTYRALPIPNPRKNPGIPHVV